MPLLCALGRHRPQPIARWNHGYYFAKCQRCGTDLVRTAYGRWQVPTGFRVVWQAKPPADADAARLEPIGPAAPRREAPSDGAAPLPPAPPFGPPAPVQTVTLPESLKPPIEPGDVPPPDEGEGRDLAPPVDEPPAPDLAPPPLAEAPPVVEPPPPVIEPPAVEPPPQAEPLPQPEPPPPQAEPPPVMMEPRAPPYRPYAIPDFMNEEAERPSASPRPQVPLIPEPVEPSTIEPPTRRPLTAWSQPLAAGARRQVERYRARRASVISDKELAAIEVQHMGSPAIAFLLAVIIIAVIIYLGGRPAEEEARPAPQAVSEPTEAPAVRPPPPVAARDAAFITASIVNCRLAPAEQAPRVRKIVRGEQVAVLARDENWASISYRGGQCWVLSRYLAQVEPLPTLGASGWQPPDA